MSDTTRAATRDADPARILVVTQDFPPRPGGIARYYSDLAAGYGHGFTVLSGSWNGELAAARSGESIVPLDLDAREANRFLSIRRAMNRMRAQIRRERPSVLLAGNVRPYALPVRSIAGRERIPWGIFVHGKDILRTARRWRRDVIKRYRWRRLMETPLIIANSRFTAGEAVALGFGRSHVVVVPPEVDADRFRPATGPEEVRTLRRRFSLPEDAVLTLFAGRFVERKGLGDLFNAMAARPDVRLVVVGAGAWEPWRDRARAAGVIDRVHYGGSPPDDELPLWYRAADLFAAPSRHMVDEDDVEGFGIVLLEAQASGLPVIATRAGGIPEAVDENTSALLVPPADVDALGHAWDRLRTDEALRIRMGTAARGGPPARHGRGSSARSLVAALEDWRHRLGTSHPR